MNCQRVENAAVELGSLTVGLNPNNLHLSAGGIFDLARLPYQPPRPCCFVGRAPPSTMRRLAVAVDDDEATCPFAKVVA